MKGFWSQLTLGCANDGATTRTMQTYGTFADTGGERLPSCCSIGNHVVQLSVGPTFLFELLEPVEDDLERFIHNLPLQPRVGSPFSDRFVEQKSLAVACDAVLSCSRSLRGTCLKENLGNTSGSARRKRTGGAKPILHHLSENSSQ